jgi:hypothetical protein
VSSIFQRSHVTETGTILATHGFADGSTGVQKNMWTVSILQVAKVSRFGFRKKNPINLRFILTNEDFHTPQRGSGMIILLCLKCTLLLHQVIFATGAFLVIHRTMLFTSHFSSLFLLWYDSRNPFGVKGFYLAGSASKSRFLCHLAASVTVCILPLPGKQPGIILYDFLCFGIEYKIASHHTILTTLGNRWSLMHKTIITRKVVHIDRNIHVRLFLLEIEYSSKPNRVKEKFWHGFCLRLATKML